MDQPRRERVVRLSEIRDQFPSLLRTFYPHVNYVYLNSYFCVVSLCYLYEGVFEATKRR